MSRCGYCGGESCGLGRSALSHIFGTAAASSELGHGFFQERAHVMGLAGGLREDERRLRRLGGEQRDHGGRLPRQLLSEQLEEVEIAVGKSAYHLLAALAFGSSG